MEHVPVKDVYLQVLQDALPNYSLFVEQHDVLVKNLHKVKQLLLRHQVAPEQDTLLRVLFLSQLPFQFGKVVLDKMALSALYSDDYFQQLNQDAYYSHCPDITAKHHFHLRFWQNVLYFLEIGELRMMYNNNSIRILCEFMECLEPVAAQLSEFPLFYLLLSFLSGKNLPSLIAQMGL